MSSETQPPPSAAEPRSSPSGPASPEPRTRWGLIFGLWAIPAAIETLQRYLMSVREGEPSLVRALVFTSALLLPWALLTPLVLRLARRFPIGSPRRGRALAVHVATSAGIAVLYLAWITFVQSFSQESEVKSWDDFLTHVSEHFLSAWISTVFIYGILAGIGMGLELRRRYRERELEASQLAARAAGLEKRLADAQLAALRQELQPHFLFNTLNAVSALIEEDPAAARTMLARLSDLLRLTLDAGGEGGVVSLQKEIDHVERYLDIERVRFGERLRVEYEVGDDVLPARVPHLLLQPLVENAIRHGIAPLDRPGQIRIAARENGGALRLTVDDNGAGLAQSKPREGIGLANTRERLAQLYGTQGRLELHGRNGHGAKVIIELPFVKEEEAARGVAASAPG